MHPAERDQLLAKISHLMAELCSARHELDELRSESQRAKLMRPQVYSGFPKVTRQELEAAEKRAEGMAEAACVSALNAELRRAVVQAVGWGGWFNPDKDRPVERIHQNLMTATQKGSGQTS